MTAKRVPLSLYTLSIREVAQALMRKWNETFTTDFHLYSEEIKCNFIRLVPQAIYNQIFEYIINNHTRLILCEMSDGRIPSVASLIDSLIVPNLRRLNLNCLSHTGRVSDHDIQYLEYVILRELPFLCNLVEISLQTCGTDFTLPTCNNEILDKIGDWCPNLSSLDVSYNHTVTDEGLVCLIPSKRSRGCPHLKRISLFECSVTPGGISKLLEGLNCIKFLGYRESGIALCHFDKFNSKSLTPKKLELAHINNLGTMSRTCKDLNKLKCNEKMVDVIGSICPKLSALKIRVNDSDVQFLQKITSVSNLELVFNLGTPMSPGTNTIQYLNLCGGRLVSLSFVCDTFTTRYLKAVCENCSNLKRFWLRLNKFFCDDDISLTDRNKCSLHCLEVFFLRVGCPESESSRIPQHIISYVLHRSNKLLEVGMAVKNPLMSDSFVQQLFSSIQTATLKHIMLLIPLKNVSLPSLNLTMASVETLIRLCPQLEQLGNLLVWDLCPEEIEELRRQLRSSNSSLILINRLMYS